MTKPSFADLLIPTPDEAEHGVKIPVEIKDMGSVYLRARSLHDRRVALTWHKRFAEICDALKLTDFDPQKMPADVGTGLVDAAIAAFCEILLLGADGFAEGALTHAQAEFFVNNHPDAITAVTQYINPGGAEGHSVRGKSAAGSSPETNSQTKKPSPRSRSSKKAPVKRGSRKPPSSTKKEANSSG